MKCTIEPDLQVGDKEFGAYCICHTCDSKLKVLVCNKQYYGIGVCTCGNCKHIKRDMIYKDIFGYRFSHFT